jgi:hypothetical protein
MNKISMCFWAILQALSWFGIGGGAALLQLRGFNLSVFISALLLYVTGVFSLYHLLKETQKYTLQNYNKA